MKTTLLVGALATCALLNFAPSSSLANVLNAGDTRAAPDTFTTPPAFTILAIHTDATVSSDPVDSALLTEVVISDQSNVFGAGDLDFVLVVESDGFHNPAGSPRHRSRASKPMWASSRIFPASRLAPSTDRRRWQSVSTSLTAYRGSRIPLSWLSRRTLRDSHPVS